MFSVVMCHGRTDPLGFQTVFGLGPATGSWHCPSPVHRQELWSWKTVVACRSTFFPSCRTSCRLDWDATGRAALPSMHNKRTTAVTSALWSFRLMRAAVSFWVILCGTGKYDCWINKSPVNVKYWLIELWNLFESIHSWTWLNHCLEFKHALLETNQNKPVQHFLWSDTVFGKCLDFCMRLR